MSDQDSISTAAYGEEDDSSCDFSMACPADDEIAALFEKTSPGQLDDQVLQHIADCPKCQQTWKGLMPAFSSAAPPSSQKVWVSLKIGEVVDAGRYQVVAAIARGGQASLYQALDMVNNESVALKVFHAKTASSAEYEAEHEAEMMNGLKCSHIVSLKRRFQLREALVLVYEFAGRPLSESIAGKPLPKAMVEDYANQLITAVAFAHQHGVIHRDIKPANILVDDQGKLRVGDFGIASLFESPSHRSGTLGYMAPELLGTPSGKSIQTHPDSVIPLTGRVTPLADRFACGVVIYEMATGKKPFPCRDWAEYENAVQDTRLPRDLSELRADVRPAHIPLEDWQLSSSLLLMVNSMLERRPSQRLTASSHFFSNLTPVRTHRHVYVTLEPRQLSVPVYRPLVEALFGRFLPYYRGELNVQFAADDGLPFADQAWDLSENGMIQERDSSGYRFRAGNSYKVRLRDPAYKDRGGYQIVYEPGESLDVPIRPQPTKLPPIVAFGSGLSAVLFGLVLVLANMLWQKLNPEPFASIKQVVPIEKEGSFQVTGNALHLPAGFELVLATETSQGAWPKEGNIAVAEDGTWSHRITHKPRGNESVLLALWMVPPEGFARISNDLRASVEQDHFEKIELQRQGGVLLDQFHMSAMPPEERPVATKDGDDEITSIVRDGDVLRVQGQTTSERENHTLVLAVSDGDSYWPKQNAEDGDSLAIVPDGQTWKASIEHAPNNVSSCELSLWQVAPTGMELLQAWVDDERWGQPFKMALPYAVELARKKID